MLGTLHVVLAPVKVQLPQAVLVVHPLARVFDLGALGLPVFNVPPQCLVGVHELSLERLHLHDVSSGLVLGGFVVVHELNCTPVGLKNDEGKTFSSANLLLATCSDVSGKI